MSRQTRGDGGLWWNEQRQRWVAQKTVGYDARGKRVVRFGSGTSQSAAKRELRDRVKEYEAGLAVHSDRYTVRDAVEDWLAYGQGLTSATTVEKNTALCNNHIVPILGGRRLRELTATEVDRWFKTRAVLMTTSSLRQLKSCFERVVRRAQALGYVDRNVVALCKIPHGREGRGSKAMTFEQARELLTKTVDDPLHCYIVVSLMTGARTEELRALRWEHVHLREVDGVPPHVEVWRSVRSGGDTKTRKSRRTLALPEIAVEKLAAHKREQDKQRKAADSWADDDLVFATSAGTVMDSANVRRDFRRAIANVPSLDGRDWTPRELRHTFVSLLSDSGLLVDQIAQLIGHTSGSQVTERIYRKQLRPVIQTGATTMDTLFGASDGDPDGSSA